MGKLSLKRSAQMALISIFVSLLAVTAVIARDAPISGSIIGGYRVLPVDESSQALHFTVYRGDYIKFNFDSSIADPTLSIPDLAIEEKLPATVEEAPYFKMKTSGSYAFSLGGVSGVIEVVDFDQPNYREVTAQEAAELIGNLEPLVLDVRTPREYQQGHLEGSVLIPLQELQMRWPEIAGHQDQDVLIYCATGNRSTVAANILIENGFKRIINMRHGIVDWVRRGLPFVQ